MSLFSSLTVSASGMAAQRARTDVLVENLANAETTRTPDGGPYKRKDVVFQTVETGSAFSSLLDHEMDTFSKPDPMLAGVEVSETLFDTRDPEHLDAVETIDTVRRTGRVVEMVGLLVESEGPAAAVGDFCEIRLGPWKMVRSQVVGFRAGRMLLMPLEEIEGIQAGAHVIARPEPGMLATGPLLLGRVLDGFGQPLDGRPLPSGGTAYPLMAAPLGTMECEPISEPMPTGIPPHSLLTCGRGQRIGIFGGAASARARCSVHSLDIMGRISP